MRSRLTYMVSARSHRHNLTVVLLRYMLFTHLYQHMILSLRHVASHQHTQMVEPAAVPIV